MDGSMKCNYRSRVEGRWEVLLGDLYLYYNVNTLEVNVGKNDVDLSLNSLSDQLGLLSYTMETLSNPRETIAKAAKKDIYKELFHAYNSGDDGEAYGNLEVSGNTMSFEAENVSGRITFQRK